MHDYEGTVYWMRYQGKNRNLVLYTDRPNRVIGELNTVHLELRFLRADAVKRQGIQCVKDLLNLNPSKLFQRHLKWTDGAEQYVRRIVRKHVNEDCERYRGQETSTFQDQYRASLPRRVKGLLRRLGYDRAQASRGLAKGKPAMLDIPGQLEWPVSQGNQ